MKREKAQTARLLDVLRLRATQTSLEVDGPRVRSVAETEEPEERSMKYDVKYRDYNGEQTCSLEGFLAAALNESHEDGAIEELRGICAKQALAIATVMNALVEQGALDGREMLGHFGDWASELVERGEA